MAVIVLFALFSALCPPVFGQWVPAGPPGGDARSLALDPKRPHVVFAGTSDGILYRSDNGAETWQRLSPGFPERGFSLDEIVVDERGRVLVAYWEVHGKGGGVARSIDGGQTFTLLPGIKGESVRAIAVAPNRPDILVVGTLTGVFRSMDGGDSWQRISPAGHQDLINIESIALDVRDAGIIYAGTWHLPWKTTDGGRTWQPIHKGMIADSDVFTMILDRRREDTVYGTACSGIYRSTSGGALWSKIKGIPASSRRTRAFLQHPSQPQTFFAGTTEGLWRSDDDLATWRLVSERELVVNSLLALPNGAILAACDGAGIRLSRDRGDTWASANHGFSEHYVSRVLFDPAGGRVLAAVREDRRHGGVFAATAPGGNWTPLAAGLEGREVFSLALLGRTLFAGTDDGIFRLPAAGLRWERASVTFRGIDLHPRVADIVVRPPSAVFAASSEGLLRSDDGGLTWQRLALGLESSVEAVSAGATGPVFAATRLSLFRSDDGVSFERVSSLPANVHRMVPLDADRLLVATSQGLYEATDRGRLWGLYRGLPRLDIAALEVVAGGRTILAGDFAQGGLYRSDDSGVTWRQLPSDGLRSPRLWTLAVDPRDPERFVAASTTGGMYRYEPPAAAGAAATR